MVDSESKKNRKDYWWLVFLCAYFFLAGFQQSEDQILGSDPFYHIKASELIRRDGLIRDAPWLPYSRYHQDFPDYRWFFHFFLIPFTFGGLTAGAKNAAVLYGTLFFVLFYRLLKGRGVSNPFMWTIITLAGSSTFIFRLSLLRPFILSITFLLAALWLMFEGRYQLLLPLSFIYFWLYPPGAVPLTFLAVFHVLAKAVAGEGRSLKPVYLVVAGLIAGAIINPYFPAGIVSEIRVDYLFLFSSEIDRSIEGAELQPASTWDFLASMPFLIILASASILLNAVAGVRQRSETVTLLLVTVFFLPLALKSQRFIEYLYPLGMLYTAFSLDSTLKQVDARRLIGKLGLRWDYLYIILIVLVIPNLYFEALREYTQNTEEEDYLDFGGCARWLSENTPEYSIVFNTNWGDFTKLFYHNPRNAYVIGLEPASLYMHDETMFWTWVNISKGLVDEPGGLIAREFSASHVVSAVQENSTVLGKLANDTALALEYRDDDCVVYSIR